MQEGCMHFGQSEPMEIETNDPF